MKQVLYVLLSLLLVQSNLQASDYYVDASANPRESDGSIHKPWADIQAALNLPLAPGDVLHVKSGVYGPRGIVLQSSGTEEAPITIQGYSASPGDLASLASENLLSIATQMPRICGSNSGEGNAVDLNGQDYILIKHMAMGNFRVGIRNMRAPSDPSEGLRLEHILGKKFGLYDNEVYSGWGILLDDAGARLSNCLISDAGAEGIGVYGDGNTLRSCRVVNHTDSIATDYFIVVKGSNNTIEDCEIEQDKSIVSHSGHGIGVKNGAGNTFRNCNSKNTNKGFYVSGPECSENYFLECRTEGDVGYVIRDGAHDNRFENCEASTAEICLRFIESTEYGVQTYSALNNVFESCVFRQSKTLIELRSTGGAGRAQGNAFINCLFSSSDTFLIKGSPAKDNTFESCIIDTVGQTKTRRTIKSLDLPEGFELID